MYNAYEGCAIALSAAPKVKKKHKFLSLCATISSSQDVALQDDSE